MYTIDIDTGGTFTDGYIVGDNLEMMVKVDTTPHDLTLCFFNCIEQGAKQIGIARGDLLESTRVIRFSSTIATNAAVQMNGPKLGVIVTAGNEEMVYSNCDPNPVHKFVPPSLVVGITESVDDSGAIAQPPSPEEVDDKVRHLLENGARMLVIALKNAHLNVANEIAVRHLIDKAYPRHYLGAVPMLTSHQVTRIPDDALRANTAIINAYFHRILVHSLYKAEDLVRQSHYRYPLMIVTADFGVTRVAKTRAITTYQSGPASGVRGAHVLAEDRKHRHVLCIDVGGTTSDVSFLSQGQTIVADYRPINEVDVAQRIPDILSFGVGGGSKIRLTDGEMTVGPDSQGAVPGPACFGLGGTFATPTDVWLTLGFLDPAAYLGGRKKLQPDKAHAIIDKQIGTPLSLDTTAAALRAKAAIEASLADQIKAAGTIPAATDLTDTVLYAVGGGAGLFAIGLAQNLGIGRVYVPSMAAVFSAFGASTLDVSQAYEEIISASGDGVAAETLQSLIDTMKERAQRDMRGEGYADTEISYALEGERFAGSSKVEALPPRTLNGSIPDDFKDFVTNGAAPESYVILRLLATCPKPHPPLEARGDRASTADDARTGTRSITLAAGSFDAPVYNFNTLPLQAIIKGPAIVENAHTSILVPDGISFAVDETGGATMEV